VSHVELSQDVFRPGWILLLAPFALQILCGHVIPPVYVQDLAHSAIKASSCQLVVIASWLDTDKWNGPHLQRHPEEQRAAEEDIRRSRGWVKTVGGWGGYHQKLGCGVSSGFPVFMLALNRVFLIQSCWKDGSCSFQWTGSSAVDWDTWPGVHNVGGAG
jgi:hypothetical protein